MNLRVQTGDLQELSGSLRANAERLVRDIRRTHQALTARLEAVEAAAGNARGGERASPSEAPARRPPADAEEDFDVPEFMPPR